MDRREFFKSAQGVADAFASAVSTILAAVIEFGVVGAVALLVFVISLPLVALAMMIRLVFLAVAKMRRKDGSNSGETDRKDRESEGRAREGEDGT